MTTAEQLYGLPEPIQQQLLRIYRLAAGMSQGEKDEARGYFGTLTLYAALGQLPGVSIPSAEMVAALARIVTVADQLATPTREEVA